MKMTLISKNYLPIGCNETFIPNVEEMHICSSWINMEKAVEYAVTGGEDLLLKIYFFGFVFMAFQFAGQSTFQALGDAKHAIFFSLLRKTIIVVPLTFLLPVLGLGVNGVFLAEPISNIIGGIACYMTMRLTVYKKL